MTPREGQALRCAYGARPHCRGGRLLRAAERSWCYSVRSAVAVRVLAARPAGTSAPSTASTPPPRPSRTSWVGPYTSSTDDGMVVPTAGACPRDDLADREVEVGARLLHRRRHGPGQLPHGQGPGVRAVDTDLAGRGAQDAVDGAQQTGLAAAVRADQADDLAGTGGEGDVLDQSVGTEGTRTRGRRSGRARSGPPDSIGPARPVPSACPVRSVVTDSPPGQRSGPTPAGSAPFTVMRITGRMLSAGRGPFPYSLMTAEPGMRG